MSHLTSPILLKRRASTSRVCAVGDVINVPSLGMEGSEDSASSMGHDAFTYSSQFPDTVSAISLSDSVSHELSTCVLTSPPGTCRFRPASLTLRRHFSKQLSGGACRAIPRAVSVLVLLIMLYALAATQFSEDAFLDSMTDPLGYLLNMKEPEHGPWSVLVQHEGAVSRLNMTPQQSCRIGSMFCSPLRIGAAFLPSWTLRVVERDCADCTDRQTHDSAVEGVELQPQHAVYATSSAPLGRVGPMLLAMTSVTDDVNVRAELPQWEWLRHVYGEGFPTVGGAGEGTAQPRTPYLAVMGIPSTDQPARAALREAQRRTWLTYQEVARTENHFDAALLALYVFAAVEPKVAPDASESSSASARNGTSAAEPRRGRLSALLPTTTEYKAATEALLAATAQAEGIDDLADEGIVQRRMELRRDWNIAAVEDTPCAEVISRRVTVGAETSALSYLSAALSLPVTPAFTSPAEYVCHASSALWQEALTHRNVVWIDMMTDRRPTTNKKLGEDGKWGLPVEVGMSQKLILWLEYAYHAFRDVPFIIKGDDDSYVKVPQFLSDVRYVRNGVKRGRFPPPLPRHPVMAGAGGSSTTKAATSRRTVHTYDRLPVDRTKCFYWGSGRRMLGARFNAGMLFMLHRRLAQVILEPPQSSSDVDLRMLAVADYTNDRRPLYRQAGLHHEDVMIGVTLRNRYNRSMQLCNDETIWYVKEGYDRFHDLHRGKLNTVTWSTVVAHRCRPADAYFLHYYFQNEYRASTVEIARGDDREEVAIEAAAEWVAEQRNAFSDSVPGWDDLPSVLWTHRASAAPEYVVATGDDVAVYNYSYQYWRDSSTFVWNGYRSSR